MDEPAKETAGVTWEVEKNTEGPRGWTLLQLRGDGTGCVVVDSSMAVITYFILTRSPPDFEHHEDLQGLSHEQTALQVWP
jgi:hypothetical protein